MTWTKINYLTCYRLFRVIDPEGQGGYVRFLSWTPQTDPEMHRHQDAQNQHQKYDQMLLTETKNTKEYINPKLTAEPNGFCCKILPHPIHYPRRHIFGVQRFQWQDVLPLMIQQDLGGIPQPVPFQGEAADTATGLGPGPEAFPQNNNSLDSFKGKFTGTMCFFYHSIWGFPENCPVHCKPIQCLEDPSRECWGRRLVNGCPYLM